MPEELVLVYEKESGAPIYMHSIDAREAVQLGDYTQEAPGGKDPSPEEKASAMARTRGLTGSPHPELQTPEERAATRAAANAVAAGETAPAPPPAAPAAAHTSSDAGAAHTSRRSST